MASRAYAFLLGVVLAGPAAAQTLFKCIDARGRISYISQACDAVGLKSAGEIRDNLNVSPAYQPPARTAPSPVLSAPAPAAGTPAAAAKDAAPKEPERRCFVVKTAKGPVTRCNDVPPEDDKPSK